METRNACKVPLKLLQMEGIRLTITIVITVTITVPLNNKMSSLAAFKHVSAYQCTEFNIPESNIHHLSFERRDGQLLGPLEYKIHGLERQRQTLCLAIRRHKSGVVGVDVRRGEGRQ